MGFGDGTALLLEFDESDIGANELAELLLEEALEDVVAFELEELLLEDTASNIDGVDWTLVLLVAFRVLELSKEL